MNTGYDIMDAVNKAPSETGKAIFWVAKMNEKDAGMIGVDDKGVLVLTIDMGKAIKFPSPRGLRRLSEVRRNAKRCASRRLQTGNVEREGGKGNEVGMSEANEKQVGGSHYRNTQPWDFVHDHNIGFLRGNAIRYVVRHRAKGGSDDLRKCEHYLDKLAEKGGRAMSPAMMMDGGTLDAAAMEFTRKLQEDDGTMVLNILFQSPKAAARFVSLMRTQIYGYGDEQ